MQYGVEDQKVPKRNAICWYNSKFGDKSYCCNKPYSFDFLNKKGRGTFHPQIRRDEICGQLPNESRILHI
ncbi:Hypothetical predicted protein [Octopus vulgaris]|uniref:Uncharacterized protein n=1 Tax=Octopus vulgaris TaxID=6645 RepID=A0AA36F411_OCTVU|nr:Hypothetical predicted protein [Octopus vulgaris]